MGTWTKQGESRPREGRTRWASGPLTTRLGIRMLVWFLLLSLVPRLGSNTIGYLQSRRITEQLLERSLRAVSLAQAFHVQDRVERHVVFLDAVGAGNAFLNAAIRRAGGTRGPVEEIAGPEAVGSYLARHRAEAGDFFGGVVGPAQASARPALVVDLHPFIAAIAWSPDGRRLILRTSGPIGQEGGRDILGCGRGRTPRPCRS